MLLFTALSASVGTVTAQAKDKCILRVKISTIGSVKTLAFTPEGTYATDNGKTLKKGVVCTVKIEGSTAVLYQEGKEVCRGSNGYFRLYKTDAGLKYNPTGTDFAIIWGIWYLRSPAAICWLLTMWIWKHILWALLWAR